MKRALWLLLLGACKFNFDLLGDPTGDGGGDGSIPPPFEKYWRNGSRLRAVTLVPVAGGDPHWVGWFDTVLNTHCRNQVAADGLERCVPTEVTGDIYFSDPGCTMPLGVSQNSLCLANNSYAVGYDTMGLAHAYALGALFTGTIYDSRAGCMPRSQVSTETVYTLGAELAPTQMLGAQYHKEMIGDYLRSFQGAVDGASLEIGSLEIGGVGCFPYSGGLGPARCRGTLFRGEAVYSDSACTQRAYFWDRQSYDPMQTQQLNVFDAQACETEYRLFATVSDITAPTFYRLTSSGCQAAAMTADGRLYTATEIADPMPLGTIAVGPRRGRLGYIYWVGPDGASMVEQYYDHDLGVPCVAFVATDGKLRCLAFQPARFSAEPGGVCTGSPRSLTTGCFGGEPLEGPSYVSCAIPGGGNTVRRPPKLAASGSTYAETTCTTLDTPGGVYDPAGGGPTLSPTMFAELMEIVE